MRVEHPRKTSLACALMLAGAAFPLACRDTSSSAPDAGSRSLVKGLQVAFDKSPRPWTDAGIATVTLATPGDAHLWPVDRDALARVIAAMKAETGEALAGALQPHPAVDPALLALARGARGHGGVGEVAETALRGPLSLPVGGQHVPVLPARAALDTAAATAADPACDKTLTQPGSVGQVLAGIGRVRVVMLLQGPELARYAACVRAAPPRKDAPPEAAVEHARLLELLKMGESNAASVLLSLGPND